MRSNLSSQSGFTLLELLVALTLFSVIAIGAQSLLHTVLTTHDVETQHADELVALQKTIRLMEQDFSQLDPQMLKLAETSYIASFTRRGWNNPLGLPRSDRLAVAYALQDNQLVRYYWLTDADGTFQRETQLLLKDVNNFTVQALTPHYISIKFSYKEFGDLTRAVNVAEASSGFEL